MSIGHRERSRDRRVDARLLARVAHDEHRLGGEQEGGREDLTFLRAETGAVERGPFRQDRIHALEHRDLGHHFGIARFQRLAVALDAALDGRDVGHDELELDRGEVALGIGLDTGLRERAQHDEDRVGVAQRAEELAAEPFARLGAGRQREVHELEACGHDLLRLGHHRKAIETLVGDCRDSDRGLVLTRRREAGERTEQAVRAGAGEPDESEVFHRLRRLSTTLLGSPEARNTTGAARHEQEDEEAQAAGPPQQGEPRQEAARGR